MTIPLMRKNAKKRKNPIIALAQIVYYDTGDKHNVEKIKRYIKLAKKNGADIVCFSESCVHKTNFLSFDNDLVREIKEECKKNSIWCIIDDDMVVKGVVYNTAVLIDRKGKIAGQYRKIHLMGDSSETKAGTKTRVFKTDFAKIGIAICWDLSDAKLFKRMKKMGAEIIFCPAYWKYEAMAHHPGKYSEKHRQREFTTLKSLVMARAFENLFFVALCSPAKNKNEPDLIPYSAICTPQKVLKEIKDKEGVITAEINIKEIDKLERIYEKAA